VQVPQRDLLRFVCRADLEPWVPTYARAKEAKAGFLQHVRDLQEPVSAGAARQGLASAA